MSSEGKKEQRLAADSRDRVSQALNTPPALKEIVVGSAFSQRQLGLLGWDLGFRVKKSANI